VFPLEVSVSLVPPFPSGTVVILVDASCGYPLYRASAASTLATQCAEPWKVYDWNLYRIIENPNSEVNLFSPFPANKCWNMP
jgi:hypothetical protein